MNVLFRLAYSLAVAIFFILLVIFGQRTLSPEPDYPAARPPQGTVSCNENFCVNALGLRDPERDHLLSAPQQEYVRVFRQYQEDYDDDFRNLIGLASFGRWHSCNGWEAGRQVSTRRRCSTTLKPKPAAC